MTNILVVQDSRSINMLLQFRLGQAGYAVDAVETGEEGLAKAREAKYQLILLDYILPGMTGAEICKTLKSEPATKDVPIVFISAKDEDEIAASIKEAGAAGYIGMPFEGENFLNKIKSFIEQT